MPDKAGVELMAPVGSPESLRAAVQNGADAVYMGGKMFSARQYAPNFSSGELSQAVEYAHLHGVRVYVAVNILVDNGEIPELLDYLYTLYTSRVDAIIVQDLGTAALIRRLLPQMELHASTQMTIHNGAGVRFLEEMGFSRVVLAREVSLKNIKLIGEKSSLPLEVFVHGALCVSYSGQCLMSSLIGGRSGNRGRCAQPCRLNYTLVDSEGLEVKEGHLLSPRDLNMIEHLPDLIEAGVVALKVEGRMKRPEYVATVIRHYRQALNNYYNKEEGDCDYQVDPRAVKELTQIFNRDFTSGYFLERPGPHLMSYQRPNNRGLRLGRVLSYNSRTKEVAIRLEEPVRVGDGYQIWVTRGGRVAGEIRSLVQNNRQVEEALGGDVVITIQEGMPQAGDRVFKTLDAGLMERARESFVPPRGIIRYPLDVMATINLGEPVLLQARDQQGNMVSIKGDFLAQKAEKHPITRDAVEKQLSRLGTTVFYLQNLTVDAGEGLMVPVSELNNLRRQMAAELEKIRLNKYNKPPLDQETYMRQAKELMRKITNPPAQSASRQGEKIKISVQVGDLLSLKAALQTGASVVYFGGERLRGKKGFTTADFFRAVEECHKKDAQAILTVPRLFHEEAVEDMTAYLLQGKSAGVDGFLVGNPGTLQLAKELGLSGLIGDYSLNIFNDVTIHTLRQLGIERMTLSPEMTVEQIAGLGQGRHVLLECIVHGQFPLMITEHCAVGSILGKGHRERGCGGPCLNQGYGIKDRLNMVFPLECDEECRMHVFNPKTLCLIDKLPDLLPSNVSSIRIDARKEEASWVKGVVGTYSDELARYREMGASYRVREGVKNQLLTYSPGGFTTGHYYRGVLEHS